MVFGLLFRLWMSILRNEWAALSDVGVEFKK